MRERTAVWCAGLVVPASVDMPTRAAEERRDAAAEEESPPPASAGAAAAARPKGGAEPVHAGEDIMGKAGPPVCGMRRS